MRLRDLGNTMVVVEHDRDTMLAADWLVDLGPGAGPARRPSGRGGHAGRGVPGRGVAHRALPLGRSGPSRCRPRAAPATDGGSRSWARASTTSRTWTCAFPLGAFCCVTGVSGSGKSTLVNDILLAALQRRLHESGPVPGAHRALRGIEHVDKVVAIDQSPIGRTPRSNPATYTGTFGYIRDLFARLPESPRAGLRPRALLVQREGRALRGLRRATGCARSRCTSCRTCSCAATSATAGATTARPSRSSTRAARSPTCST